MPDGSAPDGGFETDKAGDPISAWCVTQDYEPLTQPKVGAPKVPNMKLNFLMPGASVAKIHEVPGAKVARWYLLCKINAQQSGVEGYYGWVKDDHCLIDRTCLKTEDGIYRKAMLVNSNENKLSPEEQERLKKGEGGVVPVLHTPYKSTHRATHDYLWFSFFFVYRQSGGYLLLGSSPTFDSKSVHQVVKGWVPRNNVCLWDTREAYHWDQPSTQKAAAKRRTTPAIAYREPDQAYQALFDAQRQKSFPPFLMPDLLNAANRYAGYEQFGKDGVSKDLLPYEPRFPNLGYEGTEDFPPSDTITGTGMRLLHIGCIGGWGKFEPAELAKLQAELDSWLLESSTIEIVFLIDDTLSMEKWFKEVSAIVEKIQQDVVNDFERGIQIEGKQLGQVRIAVSYYNDRQAVGRNKGLHVPEVGKLQDVAKQGKSIAQTLARHPPAKDLVPDNREMVYDGILQAIKGANFNRAARRVLVLLGDFGDVEIQSDLSPIMASALEAYSPNPIEFFPIQVVDSVQHKHTDYDVFVKQMQGIVTAVNRESNAYQLHAAKDHSVKPAAVEHAKFFPVDSTGAQQPAAQVSQFILSRYQEQKARIAERQAEISRLKHGDWSTAKPETLAQLKERNFPVKELMETKGVQLFDEGYVWQSSGLKGPAPDYLHVPQVRLWALMERREVDILATSLLAISFEGRANPAALKAAVDRQIQALAGDNPTPTGQPSTLNKGPGAARLDLELNRKIPGLESHWHSPLLRASAKSGNFHELLEQHLVDIHRRALRLQDIVAGNQVTRREVLKSGSKFPDFIDEKTVRFDRTYRIPDSPAIWYWIDVEKELP